MLAYPNPWFRENATLDKRRRYLWLQILAAGITLDVAEGVLENSHIYGIMFTLKNILDCMYRIFPSILDLYIRRESKYSLLDLVDNKPSNLQNRQVAIHSKI